MKTRSVLLSAILMAAITPAFAQTTSGTQGMQMEQNRPSMKMHEKNRPSMQMGKDMPMNGMPMGAGTQGMPMGKGMRGMHTGKNMPCTNQTVQGTGVVGMDGIAWCLYGTLSLGEWSHRARLQFVDL
jgi:hypothetical protein